MIFDSLLIASYEAHLLSESHLQAGKGAEQDLVMIEAPRFRFTHGFKVTTQ